MHRLIAVRLTSNCWIVEIKLQSGNYREIQVSIIFYWRLQTTFSLPIQTKTIKRKRWLHNGNHCWVLVMRPGCLINLYTINIFLALSYLNFVNSFNFLSICYLYLFIYLFIYLLSLLLFFYFISRSTSALAAPSNLLKLSVHVSKVSWPLRHRVILCDRSRDVFNMHLFCAWAKRVLKC